jgi:hypothetical protein
MTADDPLIEGNRKKIILFSPVVFVLGTSDEALMSQVKAAKPSVIF